MIPEWFTDLALVTGFVASICICILLVIEANVLIRLLPLIKQSADNSTKITEKIDEGENIIKSKFHFENSPQKGVIRKYHGLENCIGQDDPNHIHTKECFS